MEIQVTPEQKRGRIYMLVALGTLVAFDVVVKVLLLLVGGLNWAKVIGTLVTLAVCWFTWRGSKVAYGFLLFCIALGVAFGLIVASKMPTAIVAILFVVLGTVAVALLAPATRTFAAFQRQGEPNKAMQATCEDARA